MLGGADGGSLRLSRETGHAVVVAGTGSGRCDSGRGEAAVPPAVAQEACIADEVLAVATAIETGTVDRRELAVAARFGLE